MLSTATKKVKKEYADMTDEEILAMIRCDSQGAMEHLIERYKSFVRAKTRTYFLVGADKEDIIQEGMIGLYKAIRDFNKTKISSFRAFADICITRQIITAIKTATRQKHIPLNSYVSLNKKMFEEDSDRMLIDLISEEGTSDPEEMFIGKEDFYRIENKMGKILSSLEREVLVLYLSGKTYQEIAYHLNRPMKSIDNALQRVKKKIEKHLLKNEK